MEAKNRHVKQYKLKFYLNARHFIIINGKRGEVHPHTWEFVLWIRFPQGDFMEFSAFEKGISAFLAKYQNQTVNDFEPFVSVIPTIENITDHFSVQFLSIVSSMGGMLERVEASETPTRTYILEWESEEDGPKAKQVHESAEEPAGGLPGGTAEREEFKEKIRQSAADNIVSAMLGK